MLGSLWKVVSVMAVANILALLAVLVWLQGTKRLSGERVHELRAVFAEPVYIQEAKAKTAEREAEKQAVVDAENARIGTPPLTGEQQAKAFSDLNDIRRAELERIQEETRILRRTLRQEWAQFDRERARQQKIIEEFEEMRRVLADREGDAQFAQAVKMYESIKAKQAASMMGELVDQGKRDEVVGYLDAMKPRTASKVIAEFEKEDPELAALLVEDLKEHGLTPIPSGQEAQAPDAMGQGGA